LTKNDPGPMLHHLSLGVTDLRLSGNFYDAVLPALGFARCWATDDAIGYGRPGGEDQFAIKHAAGARAAGPGFHAALSAPDKCSVIAFHKAALQNGGRDNGPPGLRPHYGEHYFAAFVIDPDGYRLEAVCSEEE